MYLLCWRRHGGLQYIGMSQDVDRRITAHRKAGRLPGSGGRGSCSRMIKDIIIHVWGEAEREPFGHTRTP